MGQLEEANRPEGGLQLAWAVNDPPKTLLPTMSSSLEV